MGSTKRSSAYTGFASGNNRRAKARKILQVLDEAGCLERAERPRLLDIGTGTGQIAAELATCCDVISVDLRDQRQERNGYDFVRVGSESLPFAGGTFDIVVSNHVIEHLQDAACHLAEIRRVLHDDGIVYLATPNRAWPWEVHYRLPLLHYLPTRFFMALLKRTGRYREELSLLGWPALGRTARRHFHVEVFSDRICKWPTRYHLNCSPLAAGLLSRLPLPLLRAATMIHPTLVVVLKPKTHARRSKSRA